MKEWIYLPILQKQNVFQEAVINNQIPQMRLLQWIDKFIEKHNL